MVKEERKSKDGYVHIQGAVSMYVKARVCGKGWVAERGGGGQGLGGDYNTTRIVVSP